MKLTANLIRGVALACIWAGFGLALAPAQAAAPSTAQQDKATARITGSSTYIAVAGLKAAVATPDGFGGLMALDAGLDIKDAAARKTAEANMPRVRDALRSAVNGYINVSYLPDTVPDLDMMQAGLQRAADRVLGKGVAEVTISSAIIYPAR